MRGLALCLVAGAIAIAGCGSGDDSSSKAPAQQNVTASGGTTTGAAGVSAKGRATPASLCTSEGKGKPKKQCTAGLTKLDRGKASNPAAACKGLSKKKTKGVRGKSPFAVCVKAAAKLLALKNHPSSGNGSSGSGGSGSGNSAADDTSTSSDDSADKLVCVDSDGNNVPADDPDVDDCEPADSSGASASGSDDSSSADD